jgi:hypothetical protein
MGYSVGWDWSQQMDKTMNWITKDINPIAFIVFPQLIDTYVIFNFDKRQILID